MPPPMIRTALLALAALALTACSMQAMSEARVPADVRAEVNAQIDRLIAGETDFIIDAFPDDAVNPAFREQIARMVANVPEGLALSRRVVGVMGATEQAYSDTQGAVRSGTYNLAYELEFADGFLLVQTAHTLTEDGDCCLLRAINATRSDTSPLYADQKRRASIFKFLAVFIVVSTLATLIILIIRIGGRKARETQMGER